MFTRPLRDAAYMLALLKQNVLKHAVLFSTPSSLAAALLNFFGMRNSFLHQMLPHHQVSASFVATASLLLVFRSVRALDIYKEGARGVHQMVGSWYDSASTLIAFCRSSAAPREAVDNFKATIVRLFSLLNMLCLVQLEDAEEDDASHAWNFETIDMEGLDTETLHRIIGSNGKAEVVCQTIQCLIVDSIREGVLNMPAPILSRSFQDLGDGMLTFHDTRRLSRSPIPTTLLLVTEIILLIHVILSPFMVAVLTESPFAASFFTFLINFVFFLLNGLAGEIENPFGGDFNDIDVRTLHVELNERLMELLEFSTATTAKTSTRRDSCEVQFVHQQERWTHMNSGHSRRGDRRRHAKLSKQHDQLNSLLSAAIRGSPPAQRSSKFSAMSHHTLHSSDPFSPLQSQQTLISVPRSVSFSHSVASTPSSVGNAMNLPQQKCSFPLSAPSTPSSVGNATNPLSGVPYNHEERALPFCEEECSVANEASSIISRAAGGTPMPKPLGQVLESLGENDESQSLQHDV